MWSIGSGRSGVCSLFGGLVAENLGWRYIFFALIVVAVIGMLMVKDTGKQGRNQEAPTSSTCRRA